MPPDLQQLLIDFSLVFDTPTSLPPQRAHDHYINLQSDSKAVSVHPYRYPYYQKSEIERIAGKLLQSRLIKPSHSSISSPVVLVKKADGEWHFCIDYRALDQITIKDKYPILVSDELLD